MKKIPTTFVVTVQKFMLHPVNWSHSESMKIYSKPVSSKTVADVLILILRELTIGAKN